MPRMLQKVRNSAEAVKSGMRCLSLIPEPTRPQQDSCMSKACLRCTETPCLKTSHTKQGSGDVGHKLRELLGNHKDQGSDLSTH